MDTLAAASDFIRTHARLLDRRRFELNFGDGDAASVFAALAAYRNPDGGFGRALEPDLRAPTSQPAGALGALEVFEAAAPTASSLAGPLLDWLAAVATPDGGIPFALRGADGPGDAPFWARSDPSEPSLFFTSAICAAAHRLARTDPSVGRHPWLERGTEYCLRAIAPRDGAGFALEFRAVLQLLDVLADERPEAAGELERLGAFLPASGAMHVAGGAADEQMRPLDFSPTPGRPLRSLLADDVIDRDLDRLAGEQRDDGGWQVDWISYSPAAALDWRGLATVRALEVLRANGRLKDLPGAS